LEPHQLAPLWRTCKFFSKVLNEDRLWKSYLSLEYSTEEFSQIRKDIETTIQKQNTSWKEYYKNQSSWKWSPVMKADAVIISRYSKTVSREGGSNPVVLTTKPFTPVHHAISIHVDNYTSDWLGIGFCDEKVTLQNGSTLSHQDHCINSAYYDPSTKIRLVVPDEQPQQKRNEKFIETGQTITVDIDFNNMRVYYYNNDTCVGSLNVKSIKQELLDGKIFPAVAFCPKTVLTIVKTRTGLARLQGEPDD